MIAFSVFVAYVLLDFVFARYNIACVQRRVAAASTWSMLIVVFGGYITIKFVSDPWMLIPAALGAFVGTYISVALFKEKQ